MDVKYIGTYDFRVIRKEDLEAQGVTGWTTTRWAEGETKTVQDAGGKWLCDNLKQEFKAVTSTSTSSTSTTSKTSSSS